MGDRIEVVLPTVSISVALLFEPVYPAAVVSSSPLSVAVRRESGSSMSPRITVRRALAAQWRRKPGEPARAPVATDEKFVDDPGSDMPAGADHEQGCGRIRRGGGIAVIPSAFVIACAVDPLQLALSQAHALGRACRISERGRPAAARRRGHPMSGAAIIRCHTILPKVCENWLIRVKGRAAPRTGGPSIALTPSTRASKATAAASRTAWLAPRSPSAGSLPGSDTRSALTST